MSALNSEGPCKWRKAGANPSAYGTIFDKEAHSVDVGSTDIEDEWGDRVAAST